MLVWVEQRPDRRRSSFALLHGRDHALPDDVQTLFPLIASHRLVAEADAAGDGLAASILQAVPVD